MTVLVSIGIGSNLGCPADNVREAMSRLRALGEVIACSSLYLTKPWGELDQADFCNAAALVDTELSPRAFLSAVKSIEAAMGRSETYRWGPRLIDLDILTYGELEVNEPGLFI